MPADQDTVKLDVLVELLIEKGVLRRDEFATALYKRLGIPVTGAKAPSTK